MTVNGVPAVVAEVVMTQDSAAKRLKLSPVGFIEALAEVISPLS